MILNLDQGHWEKHKMEVKKKTMHLEFFVPKIWRIWKHWVGTFHQT